MRTGRGPLLVAGASVLLQLVLAPAYGPHRDELYFASAGARLAWGYPDQPSLVPALAAVATAVAPGNLVVLRLPSMLAMAGVVLCAAAFSRLLGGDRRAQLITAVVTACSAIALALGHRLSTASLDMLVWAAVLLVAGTALVRERPRLWLLAGAICGVGLHAKHAVVVLLLGLLVGLATTPQGRAQLRTPYPWLGAGLAVAIWSPNLLWQADHGFPALALGGDIAEENAGLSGRLALVQEILLIFSPVIAVVWVAGWYLLLRSPRWRALRPVGVAVVVATVVFLVTGGKGYYLAGAVVPLLAAGCTAMAGRWPGRRSVGAAAALALSAAVAWPAVVPLLPAPVYASSFYPALDGEQLETIGWPELVATITDVAESLPDDVRQDAVVITQNYGEAGALEWYGSPLPVASGHNGWGYWDEPAAGATVIAVGFDDPVPLFAGCELAATIGNDAGADNEESAAPVWVCESRTASWDEVRFLSA